MSSNLVRPAAPNGSPVPSIPSSGADQVRVPLATASRDVKFVTQMRPSERLAKDRHLLTALPSTDPAAGRRLLQMNLVELDSGGLRFDVPRAREIIDGQPGPSLGEPGFEGGWSNYDSAPSSCFALPRPPRLVTADEKAVHRGWDLNSDPWALEKRDRRRPRLVFGRHA
jgi:hypothetical protein